MNILIRYAIYALIAAFVVGGGLVAWQRLVAGPYREEGRAEVRAKLLPILKTATDQLIRDVVAFKQIEGYMLKIKADSEKIGKQVATAQTANSARRGAEKTRIEYIDRVVLTGSSECERTKDAIRQVLR